MHGRPSTPQFPLDAPQPSGAITLNAEKMITLKDSIDSLYAAFGDVPKPKKIDACPCCVEDKNLCTLLTKPLRELTPDDLSSYASSAFLTAGDVPDYLYFLPRILDISATNGFWWPAPEVTGRAISNTVPRTWSPKHLTAIHDFLHSLIGSLLEREDSGSDINSWICAIGKMGLDTRPYLSQLEKSPAHVLAYYEENANRLTRRKLSNSFWEPPNDAYDQVVDWFGTEAVGDIIFGAYGVVLYYNSEGMPRNPQSPCDSSSPSEPGAGACI